MFFGIMIGNLNVVKYWNMTRRMTDSWYIADVIDFFTITVMKICVTLHKMNF